MEFCYAVSLVLICHAAVLTRKCPEVKCVSIKLFIILSLPKAFVDSNMLTHCLLIAYSLFTHCLLIACSSKVSLPIELSFPKILLIIG